MPEWLQVIIGIIGLLGTLLGILGLTTYHNERIKHKANKKNMQEDLEQEELETLKYKKYKDDLRQIIQEENIQILKDLNDLKRNLALNTEGTVTILRNDMKRALDFYKDKGYASASDKANWMELYNTYAGLGGNHFKEFINEWRKELEELPLKKKTRQRLNENKK